MMCFQMKPETDMQLCQQKYDSQEREAGESKRNVCIFNRRNEGLDIWLNGNVLPSMLEARRER